MNILEDNRIVMTLDAGGTNFVFSALQNGLEIIDPIVMPSNSADLEKCLKTIISGFNEVKCAIFPNNPAAISFAFPGPADYKKGIIGDLPNFPSFRGGVALGPMLEKLFNVPTLINNDGDLFAYGEAVAGFLPRINSYFRENKINREFQNLIGITLGTGFGAGLVINKQICLGDNSAAGEIWLTRNYLHPKLIAEESVSIRGIQRIYTRLSGDEKVRAPIEIYEIAMGNRKGNKDAALMAFEELAVVLAESLANAITLFDAPIVIGGGVSGAADLILPYVIKHLQSTIEDQGKELPRCLAKIINMDNQEDLQLFLNKEVEELQIPFSNEKITFTKEKYIPIGITKLGASNAISVGAYRLALNYLDKTNLSTSII